MDNTDSFKVSRMLNLIRFEWMNKKKIYVVAFFSMIAFLITFFQSFFYSNLGSMRWESGYYHGVFIGGIFFVAISIIGQSFLDLREKKSARQYLLLPASHIEKYIVQFLVRFVLPLMIYPVLFWLASVFSVGVFKVSIRLFFEFKEVDFPEPAQFFQLFSLPSEQETIIYWILWGLILLISSLMFSGGVIFGKLNSLLMPLSVLLFWGLMTLSFLGLSWILKPDSVTSGDQVKFEMINFDYPEVFPDVPLLIVVMTALLWLATFLSYVASYFKLTEKEV